MATVTLMESIEDKYACHEDEFSEFVVFFSNSPESSGRLHEGYPSVLTLCDFDIEAVVGSRVSFRESRLGHVVELDLADNLLSDWSEVLLILESFPRLEFLNLSKNLLSKPLSKPLELNGTLLPLRKLVLNGNRIGWESLQLLTSGMHVLEDLHVCNNGLSDPDGTFRSPSLRNLYLTCNSIGSFEEVWLNLGRSCPNLELLSLAECPLRSVPDLSLGRVAAFEKLAVLNVSTTKFSSWDDIDAFRTFPALTQLRVKNCPILDRYTAHERRMMVVARLPNVLVLNGGDKITPDEREDAERAFIRYYMDTADDEGEHLPPQRYHELVAVHGRLEPLVNFSMKPKTHVRVTISCAADDGRPEAAADVREEVISVYQTVTQFKAQLQRWFLIPAQNMRLFYCDQAYAGPEEMKWPQKRLYTYNVRDDDSFIVDEKVASVVSRKKSGSDGSRRYASCSPRVYDHFSPQKYSVSMGLISKSRQHREASAATKGHHPCPRKPESVKTFDRRQEGVQVGPGGKSSSEPHHCE